MLSIFSCACWPSACLLWRNVCLVFCPFFDLVICFLVFESYELFVNFEIKPLFVTSSANIFSHFVGCLFFLFIVSFAMQKPLSLISYPLPLFFKISIALWDLPKKTRVWLSENLLPVFYYKSFMIRWEDFKVLQFVIMVSSALM